MARLLPCVFEVDENPRRIASLSLHRLRVSLPANHYLQFGGNVNFIERALFVLGINTNLRASDLLRIKVAQVMGLKPGNEIEIKEKKIGKLRRITLNKAAVTAIQAALNVKAYDDGDYLFKSAKGPVLAVPSVHRLVKGWCRDINLKGNYGSHTLRKTWGYHQRVTFGVGLPELMVAFNHSSQRQTLDYLCVQPDEIRSIYENEL